MDKFNSKVSLVAFYLYEKTTNPVIGIYSKHPLKTIEMFINDLNNLPIAVSYSYSLLNEQEELQVLECYIHLMKGGA